MIDDRSQYGRVSLRHRRHPLFPYPSHPHTRRVVHYMCLRVLRTYPGLCKLIKVVCFVENPIMLVAAGGHGCGPRTAAAGGGPRRKRPKPCLGAGATGIAAVPHHMAMTRGPWGPVRLGLRLRRLGLHRRLLLPRRDPRGPWVPAPETKTLATQPTTQASGVTSHTGKVAYGSNTYQVDGGGASATGAASTSRTSTSRTTITTRGITAPIVTHPPTATSVARMLWR